MSNVFKSLIGQLSARPTQAQVYNGVANNEAFAQYLLNQIFINQLNGGAQPT